MYRPELAAKIRRKRFHRHRTRGRHPVPVHPNRIGNLAKSEAETHVPAIRRGSHRIGIAPVIQIDFCRHLEQVPSLDNLLKQGVSGRRSHVIMYGSRARAADPVVRQLDHIASQIAEAHRIRESADSMQTEISIH